MSALALATWTPTKEGFCSEASDLQGDRKRDPWGRPMNGGWRPVRDREGDMSYWTRSCVNPDTGRTITLTVFND
jgi:hypothetical protein